MHPDVTGPSTDHTTQTDQGFYYSVSLYDADAGTAVRTATQSHPKTSFPQCLRFW